MPENKDLVWFFAVLAVSIVVFPLLMWGLGGGYMSGMMGVAGYGWGFMFLVPLAFLALIALGAYYLVAGSARTRRPVFKQDERSIEILKERYAGGEITREQFLKMKKELNGF